MKIHVAWIATGPLLFALGFFAAATPVGVSVKGGDCTIPVCGARGPYPCVEVAAIDLGDI